MESVENEFEENESELPDVGEMDDGNDHKDETNSDGKSNEPRLLQLPLSRVKSIMKLDPEITLATSEACFVVTKATELFIESLARESFAYTAASKKKTVQKRDVDLAIASIDSLMFLDGSMNF